MILYLRIASQTKLFSRFPENMMVIITAGLDYCEISNSMLLLLRTL